MYNALKDVNPNLIVYRREEVPDEYHYKNHRRVPPIVVEGRPGATVLKVNNTQILSCAICGASYRNDPTDISILR